MNVIQKSEVLACGIGVLVGALATYQIFFSHTTHTQSSHSHDDTHQITQPDEEYHVHADFLIYVNDERLDLARDEFMTTSEQELHEHVHLHDDNGEVLHLHQESITFAEFLDSLGKELTTDCLSFDSTSYCSNDTKILALYVNYEPYNNDLTTYEPKDDDAVLLYYGEFEPEKITQYMNEVNDDACYYSGTCPERGVAPPESCGLTCEI